MWWPYQLALCGPLAVCNDRVPKLERRFVRFGLALDTVSWLCILIKRRFVRVAKPTTFVNKAIKFRKNRAIMCNKTSEVVCYEIVKTEETAVSISTRRWSSCSVSDSLSSAISKFGDKTPAKRTPNFSFVRQHKSFTSFSPWSTLNGQLVWRLIHLSPVSWCFLAQLIDWRD